jgi:rubrerythrin
VPNAYSISEIVEIAVETEKGGREFYETVAAQSKNQSLKTLFRYLAGEENRHIQVFRDIAKTIKVMAVEMPANLEEVSLYLKAVADSRYFLDEGKALSLAKDTRTAEEAIELALAFEKETLVFYLEAADAVPAANRPAIEALIHEERAHIRKLTGFLRSPTQ